MTDVTPEEIELLDVPVRPGSRGNCPTCGRYVLTRLDGKTRSHRAAATYFAPKCAGGEVPLNPYQQYMKTISAIRADGEQV